MDEAKKRGLDLVHIFNLKEREGRDREGSTDIIAHSVRDQDVDAQLISMMKARDIGYIPTLTRDLSVFIYERRRRSSNDPFFCGARRFTASRWRC